MTIEKSDELFELNDAMTDVGSLIKITIEVVVSG